MSESQKKALEQQLWNIANELRGKMDADEFRDYILGFIFYKYLSEKTHIYANNLLIEDGIKYKEIDENSSDGKRYIEAIRKEALSSLGYFLKPSELFSSIARRTNSIIEEEFDNFMNKEKVIAFNKLCQEENLDTNKMQNILDEYVFSGKLINMNDKVDKSLNVREPLFKRQVTIERVIDKVQSLISKFFEDIAA